MMPRFFSSALAILLTVTIIAPSAFLVLPQRAHAQYAVMEVGKQLFETTITAIKTTLSASLDITNTAATVAQQINEYVLQPLAFVLSGNLMKMLTAGVIQFVIGKANGTGIPQFVTDVEKSLQTVGDARALAFFDQFGRNSNSPFASSIASSLRRDYLSKTSLAGFWAANMNTLAQSTPSYAPGYLAGNWSQGGIAAWFALTTQTQNNPYTLYPAAQSKLGDLVGPGVGGATGARLTELGWGQGFTSWCGARQGTTEDNDGTAMEQTTTEDNDGTGMEGGGGGVNPGDPCTNKDGTSGTIRTPGSVIVATLNKVLGGQQDQIVRMGNVGPEINGILKNISTVMQTVNFAAEILGNTSLNTATGGLLGADDSSASSPTSRLRQFQTSPGNLGVTNSSVYQSAANSAVSGSDKNGQIAQYQSSWDTIAATTNAASTSIASLATFCIDAADAAARTALSSGGVEGGFTYIQPTLENIRAVHSIFIDAARAQAVTAQAALATQIAPVEKKVSDAAVVIAAAKAAVEKLQADLRAAGETASTTYAGDIQALQFIRPTMEDVANAMQEAQAFGAATASPAGSLTVTGGSLVDRMSLVSSNAATLKTTVCNPGSSLYASTFVSGA